MAGRSTSGRFDTSKNQYLMPMASAVRYFRNLSMHICLKEYAYMPKEYAYSAVFTYKSIIYH